MKFDKVNIMFLGVGMLLLGLGCGKLFVFCIVLL